MIRSRRSVVLLPFLSILVAPSLALAVCGDVNGSGTLTSSDALSVLRAAVGQPVTLECPASATPLESGQTSCYSNAGSSIGCTGTGQDGELQKGVSPVLTDNGDGTITDEATGLVWEKLTNDGSIHDYDNKYSWNDAFGKIVSLNGSTFAGHADWRLPNIVELRTLLDHGHSQPAVWAPFDTSCPESCNASTCSCTHSDWYWTSTTYADDTTAVWFVDFYSGYTDSVDRSEMNFVRAVRGGD